MKIKNKILFSNSALVISAIMIIIFAVVVILNQGIENQTTSLLDDLRDQSFKRTKAESKLLQLLITNNIQRLKFTTADISNQEKIREGILKGQWKSVYGFSDTLCKKDNIDFLVFFDKKGKALVNWPRQIDVVYLERHVQELGLFRNFTKFIDNEDLVDVPVFSSFEKWTREDAIRYGKIIEDESCIVLLTVSVIPNEYYDEPIGYVLSGVTCHYFLSLFEEFSRTTGQISLLSDGEMPIVWSGFPGDKDEIKKTFGSLYPGQGTTDILRDSTRTIVHGDDEYHVYFTPLSDLSGSDISISQNISSALIITGEPSNRLTEISDKIIQEGDRTKYNILKTALLITIIILLVTVIFLNLVGKRISKPIQIAADISDKIASGDLDHYLKRPSSDETGRLFRSMNIMIKNLKALEMDNLRQLKAIEESNERNEKILAAIQEGLILIDANTHRIIDLNPAAAAMIKGRRDDIIGNPSHIYIHKDKGNISSNNLNESSDSYDDGILLTNDGDRIPILRAVVPIRLGDRECLIESFMDISPLKQAQEESRKLEIKLQQAKKMEALGLLAGGVAHDLNNVLSGIVSIPDLILSDLPKESPIRETIELIKLSGLKSAAIVNDLLTLARRSITHFEAVSLNKIIDDYLKSPEHIKLKTFHPKAYIKTNLAKNLLNVMGSSVHLSQIVMNLVSNAAESMPSGGEILISTENNQTDAQAGGDIKAGDSGYVVLSISDTGVGMSEECQDRIFEPFYTKKILGRSGTGLGMAVVWGTVKDHNGYIDIQSVEGKGTTLKIFLPGTKEKSASEDHSFAIDNYMGNGESILVVDDEEDQRKYATLILTRLGYRVAVVSSGEQAVEYLKKNTIDLVVLDMIMDPGIDGLETYRKILEIRPTQKAIISSGFSDDNRVKEALRIGVGNYIKKPYSVGKIAIVLKMELNK